MTRAALRRAPTTTVSNEVLVTQIQVLAADGLVEVVAERKGAASYRRYGLTPRGASLLSALDTVGAGGLATPRARLRLPAAGDARPIRAEGAQPLAARPSRQRQ